LLGRIRRYAERGPNLLGRAIFHVPQNKGRALGRCEAVHGYLLHGSNLPAQQKPVRTSCEVCQLHLVLLRIGPFGNPPGLIRGPAADSVQRAVHRDAVDPGAEIRSGLETRQLAIAAQERFLYHILRVGFIAGDAKRQPEKSLAMVHYERSIGLFVSRENRLDHGVVVLAHPEY
jgi:hypothetical protein